MSAKANRRRPRSSVKVKVAFGYDDDNENADNQETLDENNTTLLNQTFDKNNGDTDLDRSYQKAFFTIHNTTVEVILENDILCWTTVTGESHDDASRRKSIIRDNTNSVNLQEVFAISPIHTHWNWSLNVNESVAGTTVSTANTLSSSAVPPSSTLSQSAVLRGFQLHSYQTMTDNILQEILIIFQSDDLNQIERWYQLLTKIIAEYKPARHVLVICNPYAGARTSRHIYNTKIKPMLERAQYKTTYAEIGDECSADEVLRDFEGDFESIDSVVIIGGDGSVINVINALIRYLANENHTKLDMENDLPSIPFPLCIIPDGTTNIICHTIQGNTDHCTPLFHLFFNQRMKIDMSAIFDIDYNFVTGNFSAGAGFPASVLKYFPRYHLHSPKTVIKKSFAKAASKKNLHPIEMEIRYIPASQNDVSVSRCYRGCPSCTPPAIEKSDDQVKAYDDSHIQKNHRRKKSSALNHDYNNRLKNSNHYNEKEKNWKILHNGYSQVAILTNANLWSFAPQGLAKFGHLADGLLDLIIIEPIIRKEFLRYLKRNGNSKNQYDLPFTTLLKVKEIEVELILPIDQFYNEISNADNQIDSSPSDNSSNEDTSDYESKVSGLQKHQPRPPSTPITEDSLRNRQRRRRLNQQTQENSPPVLQSSKSIDASVLHFKARSQQSESEMDSPKIDRFGSTTSLRRSGIFRSSRSKKNKIPLPRPSSAQGREVDDEKQQKKSRRSGGGTLQPARSLLNLLSSGKADKGLTSSSRDSFSAGTGRRPSVMSRSSSLVDNTKISDRKKKKPCMWNLDFSPYNSPLIRIKCFYRYLSVYGVGLDPDTRIKEVNYSCF